MQTITLNKNKQNAIQFEIVEGEIKEPFFFLEESDGHFYVVKGRIENKKIIFTLMPNFLSNIKKEVTNAFVYSEKGKVFDLKVKLIAPQKVNIKLDTIKTESNQKINLNRILETYKKLSNNTL